MTVRGPHSARGHGIAADPEGINAASGSNSPLQRETIENPGSGHHIRRPALSAENSVTQSGTKPEIQVNLCIQRY